MARPNPILKTGPLLNDGPVVHAIVKASRKRWTYDPRWVKTACGRRGHQLTQQCGGAVTCPDCLRTMEGRKDD